MPPVSPLRLMSSPQRCIVVLLVLSRAPSMSIEIYRFSPLSQGCKISEIKMNEQFEKQMLSIYYIIALIYIYYIRMWHRRFLRRGSIHTYIHIYISHFLSQLGETLLKFLFLFDMPWSFPGCSVSPFLYVYLAFVDLTTQREILLRSPEYLLQ